MNDINKPLLEIILKEEENYCAKCCKTQQVVERMFLEIPVLKEKVNLEYESITSKENVEKYSDLSPPIILINKALFSEGHVPIIKKLSSELMKLIKLR